MFDSLNALGLPAKYAILLGVAAPAAVFIMNLNEPAPAGPGVYLYTAAFGALCGAGAGFMRKMRGKTR